jgi:hypothetical protein
LLGTLHAAEPAFIPYTPPGGTFTCELPPGWSALEERSVRGISSRMFGPRGDERIRPAYHIHQVQKDTPGFIPLQDGLKSELRCEGACARIATPMQAWRISERGAKVFEVRESRLFPQETLPAEPVMLHHFYAFIPDKEDYFIVKLTVDEDSFDAYRAEFRRFLQKFRLLSSAH